MITLKESILSRKEETITRNINTSILISLYKSLLDLVKKEGFELTDIWTMVSSPKQLQCSYTRDPISEDWSLDLFEQVTEICKKYNIDFTTTKKVRYYMSNYYIHSVYQGEPFTMMVIQSTKERNRYSINLNIDIPKEYESIVK